MVGRIDFSSSIPGSTAPVRPKPPVVSPRPATPVSAPAPLEQRQASFRQASTTATGGPGGVGPQDVSRFAAGLSVAAKSPQAQAEAARRADATPAPVLRQLGIPVKAVLELGSDSAVRDSARAIANKINAEGIQEHQLIDSSGIGKLQTGDKLTIVAHGEGERFGGKSPQELAAQLKAQGLKQLGTLSLKGCDNIAFARELQSALKAEGIEVARITARNGRVEIGADGRALIDGKYHAPDSKKVLGPEGEHDPYAGRSPEQVASDTARVSSQPLMPALGKGAEILAEARLAVSTHPPDQVRALVDKAFLEAVKENNQEDIGAIATFLNDWGNHTGDLKTRIDANVVLKHINPAQACMNLTTLSSGADPATLRRCGAELLTIYKEHPDLGALVPIPTVPSMQNQALAMLTQAGDAALKTRPVTPATLALAEKCIEELATARSFIPVHEVDFAALAGPLIAQYKPLAAEVLAMTPSTPDGAKALAESQKTVAAQVLNLASQLEHIDAGLCAAMANFGKDCSLTLINNPALGLSDRIELAQQAMSTAVDLKIPGLSLAVATDMGKAMLPVLTKPAASPEEAEAMAGIKQKLGAVLADACEALIESKDSTGVVLGVQLADAVAKHAGDPVLTCNVIESIVHVAPDKATELVALLPGQINPRLSGTPDADTVVELSQVYVEAARLMAPVDPKISNSLLNQGHGAAIAILDNVEADFEGRMVLAERLIEAAATLSDHHPGYGAIMATELSNKLLPMFKHDSSDAEMREALAPVLLDATRLLIKADTTETHALAGTIARDMTAISTEPQQLYEIAAAIFSGDRDLAGAAAQKAITMALADATTPEKMIESATLLKQIAGLVGKDFPDEVNAMAVDFCNKLQPVFTDLATPPDLKQRVGNIMLDNCQILIGSASQPAAEEALKIATVVCSALPTSEVVLRAAEIMAPMKPEFTATQAVAHGDPALLALQNPLTPIGDRPKHAAMLLQTAELLATLPLLGAREKAKVYIEAVLTANPALKPAVDALMLKIRTATPLDPSVEDTSKKELAKKYATDLPQSTRLREKVLSHLIGRVNEGYAQIEEVNKLRIEILNKPLGYWDASKLSELATLNGRLLTVQSTLDSAYKLPDSIGEHDPLRTTSEVVLGKEFQPMLNDLATLREGIREITKTMVSAAAPAVQRITDILSPKITDFHMKGTPIKLNPMERGEVQTLLATIDLAMPPGAKSTKSVTYKLSDFPESSLHILQAWVGHKGDAMRVKNQAIAQPNLLTVNRGNSKANRADSLQGIKTGSKEPKLKHIPVRAKLERDEYPFAMTKQGGSNASIRYVIKADNGGSGSFLGGKLRAKDPSRPGKKMVEDNETFRMQIGI